MNRTVLLMIIAVIGFSNFASANIRGPYINKFSGSTEIRTSIPNLTVMREDLLFECDFPYRGSLREVENQLREVQTSATYLVLSENDIEANFDFILTVNQPVKASVNGIVSDVSAPISLNDRMPDRRPFLNNYIDSSYKVTFSGQLKKGLNTINVSYSQPMSVCEKMGGLYPFFITSKFRSSFSYNLSPLREWNIDDAFTMNIRITFKDDSGWLKHLFGSDYETHLFRVSMKEYTIIDSQGLEKGRTRKESTEIPYSTSKGAANDMQEIIIQFKKDFPDILEATCEY